MSTAAHADLEKHLRRFGLRNFRPGQREVIDAVVDGADCLCIMPTGGGKSLCYQLPAVARDGVVLVVSPLIALMKDQVDALNQLGIPADFINSTLAPADQSSRLARLAAGDYELMYVAPERFRSPRFTDALRHTHVQLLAVDEAHCISEWGHDFRHDYARLGEFRRRLGNPQTIALTATATMDVRQDVVRQLQLRSPQIFIAGFARPNLHYDVQSLSGKRDKADALLHFLREDTGPGIIYAATRKACGEIAEIAASTGRHKALVYHGGLLPDERRRVQDQFMSGRAQIVAATNAFGMGIDKPDVRFVLHFNMPGSLEAYYQEAGRAGRDGETARCRLLYSRADRYIQEFFIDSAFPPPETIAEVYEYLRSHDDDPIELTRQELKEQLALSIGAEGVGTCERLLEKSGVLERLEPHQNMAAVRLSTDLHPMIELLPAQARVQRSVLQAVERLVGDRRHERVYLRPEELADATGLDRTAVARAMRELMRLQDFDYVPPFRGRALHMLRRDLEFDDLDIDFDELERRRRAGYDKLDCVIRYAKSAGCRQDEILRYFGEHDAAPCGTCDNCRAAVPSDSAVHESVAVMDGEIQTSIVIVLSGVARAQGRCGRQLIAGMLCGSKSNRVSKLKLDQLSTFGLLSHLTQPEITQVIDELIEQEMVEQTDIDRFRPVLRITEKGSAVMRGRVVGQSSLNLPVPLLNKLKATSAGAHAALHDAPAESDQKPAKTASLQPVAQHVADRAVPTSADVQPSHYWTWRLLRDGYSARQCCKIRGLQPEAILDHALRAVESGLHVELDWLLSSDQVQALERTTGDPNPQRLRPLMAQLPDEISQQHLELFMKCRAEQRKSKST